MKGVVEILLGIAAVWALIGHASIIARIREHKQRQKELFASAIFNWSEARRDLALTLGLTILALGFLGMLAK